MSHQFNQEFEQEMYECAEKMMYNIRLEKSELFLQMQMKDDVLTNTSPIPKRKRRRNYNKVTVSSSERQSSMNVEIPVVD